MTAATIIALGIGLVLIVVSFLLTGKDEAKEEEAAVEKTTPGLREDLTEADKKQLRKLTDTFIREYGKKQVKDLTRTAIETEVKSAVSEKQPVIEVKIADKMGAIDQKLSKVDQKLAEIDARSEAGVKAVSNQASAISAGWATNRQEVQTVFEQIVDKEKEVKIQLGLIDEYKKGLEKLKEEADLSVTRLQELQQVEAAGRFAAAESSAEVSYAEAGAENEELSGEAVAEEAVEAAKEEVKEEIKEAVEEEIEEKIEDSLTDEAKEAEAGEVEGAFEQAAEEAVLAEASDVREADEDLTETPDDGTEEEDEESEAELEMVPVSVSSEISDSEEDPEDEDYEEEDYEEEAADEEEDPESEYEEEGQEESNIVAFPQDSNSGQKAIEDAVRDTLVRKARKDRKSQQGEVSDDDDFDDEFDDEEDDLKAITNLDQILDREGIDLTAEDPTVNILTMYGAGLSIIEISKVLKMGVGEVKYIIDSNTKNQ